MQTTHPNPPQPITPNPMELPSSMLLLAFFDEERRDPSPIFIGFLVPRAECDPRPSSLGETESGGISTHYSGGTAIDFVNEQF